MLSHRLQQIQRIVAQVNKAQLPIPISEIFAYGRFAAGDENAPLDLVVETGLLTEKLLPAETWQRVQDTHALLVHQQPDVAITFHDDPMAFFNAHQITSYIPVWSFGGFCLWDEPTSFCPGDPQLLDLAYMIDPGCFEFDAKTFALCRQLITDGTLAVQTPADTPVWTFSPRQTALLARPGLVESLSKDSECLEAALRWMSSLVAEGIEEEFHWFRPGLMDSTDGSIRVRYGLVPLKEVLHDYAANADLDKCIVVGPTGRGPRKIHIFIADDGLDSAGLVAYQDRLANLED